MPKNAEQNRAAAVLRAIGVRDPFTVQKLAQSMYKRGYGWEVQGTPGVMWVAVFYLPEPDEEVETVTADSRGAIGHVEVADYDICAALTQAYALALEASR
ncbi:hypothetical protein [Deinococcus ruber]|nr:hypothetical protein [Deinococcus ruber]